MDQLGRATALMLRRLRLDWRGLAGHLVRLFAAASLLFTVWLVMETRSMIGAPGLAVFSWVVFLDAMLISVASVTVFSMAIAGEREQGTLGLLRMTGTSTLSLLAGQGLSGLILGGLLLAVQFPFVVLTITLGGILWSQVLAAYLALFAHLVFCAGLGLFCSTVCRRASSAAGWTVFVQLLLFPGMLVFGWGLSAAVRAGNISVGWEAAIRPVGMFLRRFTVWDRMQAIAASFGDLEMTTSQFWLGIAVGLALIGVAALLLDRRPVETPAWTPFNIRLWKNYGHRAWKAAIAGKDFRQFMGGRKGFVARCLFYPLFPLFLYLVMNGYMGSNMTGDDYAWLQFWTAFIFLVIECTAIASRMYRNEIAEQTWSTLILLPRAYSGILASKQIGVLLGLIPGLLTCAAAAACSDSLLDMLLIRGRYGSEAVPLIFLTLALVWISATAAAAMLFIALPPSAAIFLGLIGLIFHYAVTIMLVQYLMRWMGLTGRNFDYIFIGYSWPIITIYFLIAFVRLRKLSARD